MKKHSIETGLMKGGILNLLSVFQSKKDFESLNDLVLMDYFDKSLLLTKLTIASFLLTPTIAIIAMELKT